jgi:hypothetical protein
VTAAVKIIDEIRQAGDPFENGPVDWRTRSPQMHLNDEVEAFIERMKTAVTEVERGAPADAAPQHS